MRRSSAERNVSWSELTLMELMWYTWALRNFRRGHAFTVSRIGAHRGTCRQVRSGQRSISTHCGTCRQVRSGQRAISTHRGTCRQVRSGQRAISTHRGTCRQVRSGQVRSGQAASAPTDQFSCGALKELHDTYVPMAMFRMPFPIPFADHNADHEKWNPGCFDSSFISNNLTYWIQS